VPSEASSNSPPTAVIAIGAAIVLAIGGFFIWRTAERPPHSPPPQLASA
jgi:hypothetical protein